MINQKTFAWTMSLLLAFGAVMTFAEGRSLADDSATTKPSEHDEDKDEVKIAVDQVPQAVADAVKNAFSDAKITDAEKESKHGDVIYELDVISGGKTYEVKLTAEGKILKQEIEDEKHEGKEKD